VGATGTEREGGRGMRSKVKSREKEIQEILHIFQLRILLPSPFSMTLKLSA
jgi:hypothetical protein